MGKHSPEILTGRGVASMIGSTVLAVKATPKALYLLEEATDIKGDKLTPVEVVKTAWKPYIPAALTGIAGVTCVIGATAVNQKRNAALAAAYAISERTLVRYRDKVIETIGEKKEKEMKEKISQDMVNEQPVSKTPVIVTSKGNPLCMDSISGRYFRSDIDVIRKVVNELNRDMTYQNYISLDDLYTKLNLDSTGVSADLGWSLDDGLIDIEFDTCLADNEPCVVLNYTVKPRYDYDRFA